MLTLDIRELLRKDARPQAGSATLDFSARDFPGFSVPGPVGLAWQAAGAGGLVELELRITCRLEGECVRCLAAFTAPLEVERELEVRAADLEGEYTEYPVAPGGGLDLEELAYGEVLLEAPLLQLCREDCPGLCQTCGLPKAAGDGPHCTCPPEEAAGEAEPPPDPRWDKLRALLAEGGVEDGEDG